MPLKRDRILLDHYVEKRLPPPRKQSLNKALLLESGQNRLGKIKIIILKSELNNEVTFFNFFLLR